MMDFQQSFKLENIIVNPKTDQLSFNGTTLEIKSMAMKVLCYFANNQEKLISRDCLRENVWKNLTTSNHTINNNIYSLRQTIAKLDPDTKYIHTVTGSNGNGYRLLVDVTQVITSEEEFEKDVSCIEINNIEDINKDNPHPTSTSNHKNKMMTSIGKILIPVILLSIVAYYVAITPHNYDKLSQVTSHLGREQSPAISNDGQIMLFSNRTSRDATWELYATDMNSPNQSKKVFNTPSNSDNFVSISPNKRYISFLRNKKGAWGIYIADFNSKNLTASNSKLIIELDEVNFSPAISWLNNSQFFYTAQEASWAPLKIYLYDLALDSSEQITSPPVNTFGDYALMVSPDKTMLAIMRSDEASGYHLKLLDLHTKALQDTKVFSNESRLNISFSDNSESIYFIDNKGFLSSYNIDKQSIEKISQKNNFGYWPLKVPGKNQFIMQQDWGLSSLTTQIVKFKNPVMGGDGSSEVIVNNGLSIRSIEGISDGGLIFASIKPNFQIELWHYKNGKSNKLSEFNEKSEYRYPLSLNWLPGSDKALLSINKSCRLININTGKDLPLCPANEDIYAGRFSNDGQSIHFPGFKQEAANAIEMGITGYPVTNLKKFSDANMIVQGAKNDFYYSKEFDFDIYHYNPITQESLKIVDRTFVYNSKSNNHFVLSDKGIYYMDRVKVRKNAIYFYDFKTKKIQHVINSRDNYPNIVLSEDEKFIYLIQSVDNNSHLFLLE